MISRPDADLAGERIHKALARAGWGSRREIERLVSAGRVRLNGQVAALGATVRPGDQVQIDGGRVVRLDEASEPLRVLAYNKPVDVVCTRHDEFDRPTIFAKLPRIKHGRWINVGRLDINTSGLLLFTNHGELAHRLMHPRYRIDREYAARIYGEVDADMLARLRAGVDIDAERFRFDDITPGAGEGTNRWYYCVVQSGRNREVRRLWESQGVQVSRLMRVRFGNIMLPTDLRAGRQIELGGALLDDLCALVDLKPDASATASRRRRSRRKFSETLFEAYGAQGWWPAKTPFEMIVGAVLIQRNSWRNAALAVAAFEAARTAAAVAAGRLTPTASASLIEQAGFYRQKSQRLADIATWFCTHGGYAALASLDDRALRGEFLALAGIGEETADAICLYAFGRPNFVVDAYLRRIFLRLGLIGGSESYAALRHGFESALGADAVLYNEYHALIVEHGKRHCRARPRCGQCVLLPRCPTGVAQGAVSH